MLIIIKKRHHAEKQKKKKRKKKRKERRKIVLPQQSRTSKLLTQTRKFRDMTKNQDFRFINIMIWRLVSLEVVLPLCALLIVRVVSSLWGYPWTSCFFKCRSMTTAFIIVFQKFEAIWRTLNHETERVQDSCWGRHLSGIFLTWNGSFSVSLILFNFCKRTF